jgi:hypothetical protein
MSEWCSAFQVTPSSSCTLPVGTAAGGLVKSGRSVEISSALVGQSLASVLAALAKSAKQTRTINAKKWARSLIPHVVFRVILRNSEGLDVLPSKRIPRALSLSHSPKYSHLLLLLSSATLTNHRCLEGASDL